MTYASAGRVVVLGSLNADIFARVQQHPAPGETILGRGGESRAGGKGANQAAAAALCGAPVRMVGAVGDDVHAITALATLTHAGCNIESVRVVPGATGIALITVSDDGENSIIVIPGANAQVGQQDLAALNDLTAGDVLVMQGEIPVETCSAAATIATEQGARVVINLAPVVDYPAETLLLANPLVINEHEGRGALAILGLEDREDPQEIVTALRSAGITSVVMTLGSKGSLVADPEIELVPAVAVKAVDTTGAGDAFTGALVAQMVTGKSLVESAKVAALFASESVQHEGAQDSYPDWRSR